MHFPSERVTREMRSEEAYLWYVPANGGEELALLIKAPTSSIKALIAGCALKLVYGREESYLCAGARILDMPDSPISISKIQREAEEHSALRRALHERRFPAFLFNEMDVCLAWTNVELDEEEALRVLNLLGDESQLYVGSFTEDASHSLDCFCVSVDQTLTRTYPKAHAIPIVEVSPTLDLWRTSNVSFIGVRGVHTITIDDKDEGEIFERAVWASLESVFPLTLYKSPQVKIGTKLREMTDVFSFYAYGSFLIEAKDLSVLHAGYERNQDRRVRGVQKQVKKAISQLVGASKAFTRGESIFDANGNELPVARDQPPHCIVLITELMHSGDWKEIEAQLIEATRSTGAFFHLLDLREFIALLKGSSGEAGRLDYNLMKRWEMFVETGSVHIRSRPAPKSSDERTL